MIWYTLLKSTILYASSMLIIYAIMANTSISIVENLYHTPFLKIIDVIIAIIITILYIGVVYFNIKALCEL